MLFLNIYKIKLSVFSFSQFSKFSANLDFFGIKYIGSKIQISAHKMNKICPKIFFSQFQITITHIATLFISQNKFFLSNFQIIITKSTNE
jgi:D-alanine-D-alanine ligase-like ATP-grasp enzyme